MPDTMTVNDTEYTVLQLLGKGKGGYSYLVTDGEREYVLKQIHHEPCEYYTFGDKLQSELRDYETLRALGIPLPRLLAVDKAQERLLKEYIAGPTVAELRESGRMDGRWTEQVRAMCAVLYPAGLKSTTTPPTSSRAAKRSIISTTNATPIWSNGTLSTGARSTGQSRRPRRIEQIARRETGGQNFFQNPIDNPGMCCYINGNDNRY